MAKDRFAEVESAIDRDWIYRILQEMILIRSENPFDDPAREGFLQRRDVSPVRRPGEHLTPVAGVEGDGGHPGGEQLPGDREVRLPLRAEARPDLGGHWDPRRPDGGPRDRARPCRIREDRRPRASSRHLPDGASHIDVHEVEPPAGHLGRRLRDLTGVGAEQLGAHGPLRLLVDEVSSRAVGVAQKPPGRHHLRHDDVRAVLPAQAAEGGVRHPREGGEDQFPTEIHGLTITSGAGGFPLTRRGMRGTNCPFQFRWHVSGPSTGVFSRRLRRISRHVLSSKTETEGL